MIVVRYFILLLVYQLVTFYKQTPWEFTKGLIAWPYFTFTRFLHPVEYHKHIVHSGITGLRQYWNMEGAITPPGFIERRIDALGLEASS